MPNRVEKLELRVSELESTVDGLTDELVQAKERIRMLEDHVDGEVPATNDEPADPPTDEADPEEIQEATAEADKGGEGDTSDETPEESETEDDIIIA
jgi:uncharacterized coiled-coil protein SlyX